MDDYAAYSEEFSLAQRKKDDEEIADGIGRLCFVAHRNARDGGWYQDAKTGEPIVRNVPEMIALVHSEVSELLEYVRKGGNDDHLPHLDGRAVEIADVFIRLGDLAGYLNLDVAGAVVEKMEYNRNRADHKLENRAKEGGKAF